MLTLHPQISELAIADRRQRLTLEAQRERLAMRSDNRPTPRVSTRRLGRLLLAAR